MKIDYTYRDEDRPIEKAEFITSFDAVVKLEVENDSEVRIDLGNICVDLSKTDFADFTALVNRINKQING